MSVTRRVLVIAVAVAALAAFAGPAFGEATVEPGDNPNATVLPDGSTLDEVYIGNFDIYPHARWHSFEASLHKVAGTAGLLNHNHRAIRGHCRIVATFVGRDSSSPDKVVRSRKFGFRVPGVKGGDPGKMKYRWPEGGWLKLRDKGHHYWDTPRLIGHCFAPSLP
jgi:hypothetical protein